MSEVDGQIRLAELVTDENTGGEAARLAEQGLRCAVMDTVIGVRSHLLGKVSYETSLKIADVS